MPEGYKLVTVIQNIQYTCRLGLQDVDQTLCGTYSNTHLIHLFQVPVSRRRK